MRLHAVGRTGPGIGLCATLLLACSSTAPRPYKLYRGASRAASEVAALRLETWHTLRIDGATVQRDDWPVVQLLPGRHRLELAPPFLGVAPGADVIAATRLELDVAAGQELRVQFAAGDAARAGHLWIVDACGGVIAGWRAP